MPEFDDEDSPRNSPTRMQTVIQNGDATSTQNGKKCNDITAVTSEDPQENQNGKLEITDNWITKDESNGEWIYTTFLVWFKLYTHNVKSLEPQQYFIIYLPLKW